MPTQQIGMPRKKARGPAISDLARSAMDSMGAQALPPWMRNQVPMAEAMQPVNRAPGSWLPLMARESQFPSPPMLSPPVTAPSTMVARSRPDNPPILTPPTGPRNIGAMPLYSPGDETGQAIQSGAMQTPTKPREAFTGTPASTPETPAAYQAASSLYGKLRGWWNPKARAATQEAQSLAAGGIPAVHNRASQAYDAAREAWNPMVQGANVPVPPMPWGTGADLIGRPLHGLLAKPPREQPFPETVPTMPSLDADPSMRDASRGTSQWPTGPAPNPAGYDGPMYMQGIGGNSPPDLPLFPEERRRQMEPDSLAALMDYSRSVRPDLHPKFDAAGDAAARAGMAAATEAGTQRGMAETGRRAPLPPELQQSDTLSQIRQRQGGDTHVSRPFGNRDTRAVGTQYSGGVTLNMGGPGAAQRLSPDPEARPRPQDSPLWGQTLQGEKMHDGTTSVQNVTGEPSVEADRARGLQAMTTRARERAALPEVQAARKPRDERMASAREQITARAKETQDVRNFRTRGPLASIMAGGGEDADKFEQMLTYQAAMGNQHAGRTLSELRQEKARSQGLPELRAAEADRQRAEAEAMRRFDPNALTFEQKTQAQQQGQAAYDAHLQRNPKDYAGAERAGRAMGGGAWTNTAAATPVQLQQVAARTVASGVSDDEAVEMIMRDLPNADERAVRDAVEQYRNRWTHPSQTGTPAGPPLGTPSYTPPRPGAYTPSFNFGGTGRVW